MLTKRKRITRRTSVTSAPDCGTESGSRSETNCGNGSAIVDRSSGNASGTTVVPPGGTTMVPPSGATGSGSGSTGSSSGTIQSSSGTTGSSSGTTGSASGTTGSYSGTTGSYSGTIQSSSGTTGSASSLAPSQEPMFPRGKFIVLPATPSHPPQTHTPTQPALQLTLNGAHHLSSSHSLQGIYTASGSTPNSAHHPTYGASSTCSAGLSHSGTGFGNVTGPPQQSVNYNIIPVPTQQGRHSNVIVTPLTRGSSPRVLLHLPTPWSGNHGNLGSCIRQAMTTLYQATPPPGGHHMAPPTIILPSGAPPVSHPEDFEPTTQH